MNERQENESREKKGIKDYDEKGKDKCKKINEKKKERN